MTYDERKAGVELSRQNIHPSTLCPGQSVLRVLDDFHSNHLNIFPPLSLSQNTAEQWQTVMYVTAGLMCACVLFYVVFASSEQQDWATSDSSSNSETEE